MSQQSKNTLQTAINSQIADNTAGDISAADIRDNLINMTDSLVFNTGSQSITGSFAQGFKTQAIGDYSHAEGDGTQAIGNYSHAEGSTQAIGEYSHAEGSDTQAIGQSSHAEGVDTQAIGQSSHTEGSNTKTGITTAYSASVTDGIVTLDSSYGDVSGEFGSNNRLLLYDYPFDGNYGLVTFIINQSSFDDTNTIVELVDTSVTTTTAYVGDITYGIDNWTGNQTIPGDYSHAEGDNTKAIGGSSHAEGYDTQAIGGSSHAEGAKTQAIGYASHAEGYNTQAIGEYSHAEGVETQAIGESSHAEGESTQAIGYASHTEGSNTKTGVTTAYSASVTDGIVTLDSTYGDVSANFTTDNRLLLYDTPFDGNYSITTFIINQSSFDDTNTIVELVDTSVTTTTAYVGDLTYIDDWSGDQTIPGDYSHAEGYNTVAIGYASHAEGNSTQAIGDLHMQKEIIL
jgi:trimeric autotransporter adhesin